MIIKILSVLLVSIFVSKASITKPVQFRKQMIAAESFESVGVFDVNNDKKPDIVSGAFWYEGPGFMKRHVITQPRRFGEYYDDFSTIDMDVDGDGWKDFITGGWNDNYIYWRKNPGKNDEEWKAKNRRNKIKDLCLRHYRCSACNA